MTPATGSLSERYRSLFVIGQGGMGTVEVALERPGSEFERVVALKRLLPEAAKDRRHVDMFLREARLAALLNHSNVVHAFDFGELHGELFLAMEYVEGEPLSEVIHAAYGKEGRFAPALVAHILAETCDGLHAAHELRDVSGTPLNVVHRDVSPHNVMVAYEGEVKLLDFGVAKMEDDRSVTRTGEVKGKTAYMSPEQAMGDKLDRRSDLYAIGALLYECLSGRRMWGVGTDMETIRRLALEEPPRLEEAAPGTPQRLCDLQRRLVARDRVARPSTAREVANELRAFIAETGTRPDPRVMCAVMTRLFATQAEIRKKALNDSLAGVVAPSRVKSLRASMGSGPPVKLPDPDFAPTVALPVERDSTSGVITPTPRVPRSHVIAVALASLAIGAAVAVVAGLRMRTSATTSGASASVSASATPNPTPTPNPTAAPTPTPSPNPTAAPTPTQVATQRPRGGGRPTPRPLPPQPAATQPAPPTPTHKPLDVDPNAIP